MGYFKDSEELEKVLGGFFKEAADLIRNGDTQMRTVQEAMQSMGLVTRFKWKNPELSLTLDATKDPFEVLINDSSRKPVAEFFLDADEAHKFWHGTVNLATALTKKQIIASGPIPKILKLIPALGPLFKYYPEYLEKIGREDLILK